MDLHYQKVTCPICGKEFSLDKTNSQILADTSGSASGMLTSPPTGSPSGLDILLRRQNVICPSCHQTFGLDVFGDTSD